MDDSAPPKALLTEEVALLPQSTTPAVSGQGPLALARALNRDQVGAVALVAVVTVDVIAVAAIAIVVNTVGWNQHE